MSDDERASDSAATLAPATSTDRFATDIARMD
jgi:hypothetical protein